GRHEGARERDVVADLERRLLACVRPGGGALARGWRRHDELRAVRLPGRRRAELTTSWQGDAGLAEVAAVRGERAVALRAQRVILSGRVGARDAHRVARPGVDGRVRLVDAEPLVGRLTGAEPTGRYAPVDGRVGDLRVVEPDDLRAAGAVHLDDARGV